jgi:hypothetical protein
MVYARGTDWIELRDFKLSTRLDVDGGANNWRVIGIDGGSFNIFGVSNWFLSGNDWGPCGTPTPIDCTSQNFTGHDVSNLVIDGDTFHDYTITPGSGAHWECLYVNGSLGSLTIRNSRFWNCQTYAIYFTGFHPLHRYAGSWTVENNWFGSTCCFGSNLRNSAINLGVDSSQGAGNVTNLLIRFNSFAPGQTLVREGGGGGVNIRAIGNIFGAAGCVSDVSYSYNVWITGACGQNASNAANPYVNPSDGAAGDYHLGAPSTADNFVTPTGADYALSSDYDRQTRSAPRDAGSDER